MKIGVIADIHENFHNLILALNKMKEEGVEQIICLGDLMNDGIAKVLSISETPVYMVWGNNDDDKVVLTKTSLRPGSHLTSGINTYDFLHYGNKKIFVTHYDDLALPMAKSGMFDIIFCGHTHNSKVEIESKCWIVVLENTVTLKTSLVDEYFRMNKERLGFRPGFKTSPTAIPHAEKA